MTVHQFQMEEYQDYIRHFKEIRKNNKKSKSGQITERKCDDQQCAWNKKKYANGILSLSPKQIIHVMFYHIEGMFCSLYTMCI